VDPPRSRDPAADALSPEFVDAYSETAAGRVASVRLRHPDPPDGAQRDGAWTFRATDLDGADHVNNSHYWGPLERDLAAGPEPDEIDAEIEYREPCQPGEVAILRDGRVAWVASPEGALHASIVHPSSP
jgi:acyl-ACP thioesterase